MTFPVFPVCGTQEIAAELGSRVLTKCDVAVVGGFDTPQLHEKCHLPGEILQMGEGIPSPSKQCESRGNKVGMVILTRRFTDKASQFEERIAAVGRNQDG